MGTPGALGLETITHNDNMSLTNGYGHPHDHDLTQTPSQTLGADSPLSDPGDFADGSNSVNGALSPPNGIDDSVVQDMATSDMDNDEEDAMGEDDDDYDEVMQRQATSHNGKRDSLSSASSSLSSKRKRVIDDEDEYMQANPELYGLRRSGRAKAVRPLTESSDDEDDDIVHNGRKRAKISKSQKVSTSRKSTERATSPIESEDDDDDDDVYGGARARAKPKHRRRKAQSNSDDATSLTGDIRFSTRRTAKVTNYNEDEQDDEDDYDDAEDYEGEAYYDEQYQQDYKNQSTTPGIDIILNHKVKEGAVAGSEKPSDYQFLVKWTDQAHYHATWEDWETLIDDDRKARKPNNYFKKEVYKEIDAYDPATPKEVREQFLIDREAKIEDVEQYSKVERVIGRRSTVEGFEYYIKWKVLPYDHATWEPATLISKIAPEAIDHYLDRISRLPSTNKKELNPATRSAAIRLQSQPAYIKGGTLRGFQLDGLNFLTHRWCGNNNAILADEMGLGKTVQTVSFCNWLFHDRGLEGPYLIVVPLSTISAWAETFALWAPELNFVIYHGPDAARQIIQEHELFVNGDARKVKFNVLLTTYEFVGKDVGMLSKVKWQFLAVDEAHRLKNRKSQLYANLQTINVPARLLITGTPMQNDFPELSALMDFLDPGQVYVDPKLNLSTEFFSRKVAELKQAMRPYLIRRTKQKVESDLPPKTERVLRVRLSDSQKELTKNILTRNYAALNGKGSHKVSLGNIHMELKKAANHAFLFPNFEESVVGSGDLSREERIRLLLQNSGKLKLLDDALTTLKAEGHRVLIFSQMVSMLDIIGDLLRLRGHPFQRLDGTIPAAARKSAIDHFNTPESTDFCFLLSTRAGGQGINLMTADTVVLFDSDYNPQADLQAMARAHRIGQLKPVSVYRLVSAHSIEEEVLERANTKRILEFVTIQRGIADHNEEEEKPKASAADIVAAGEHAVEPTDEKDISRILKKYGKKMFESSGDEEKLEEINFQDVLAKSEVRSTDQVEGDDFDGEEFLRSFQYTDVALDETSWDEIIPKDKLEEIKAEEKERENQEYLKAVIEENAPRKRKAAEDARGQRAAKKRARDLAAEAAEEESSGDEADTKDPSRTLNEKECRNLIRAFERYGSMDEMEKEVLREARLVNRDVTVVKATLQQFLDEAARKFEGEKQRLREIEQTTGRPVAKKDRKTVVFDFKGIKRLNAETLLERPEELAIIRSEVKAADNELEFRVLADVKAASYSCSWGAREDAMLLVGVYRHGFGAWATIRDDLELGLSDKLFLEEHRVGNKTARTGGEDKNAKSPGAVHLVRRTNYLSDLLRLKASGGSDERAKRAVENHHRSNRKLGNARARVATPQNGSASPLRAGKNADRAKDHKHGTDRREKLSTTNGISKATHSRDPAKSVKRRISDDRRSKDRASSQRHVSPNSRTRQDPVTWDREPCNQIFSSMARPLLELQEADSKKYPVKADQLEALRKGLTMVGDRIEESCKQQSDVTADTLWTHVAYFHWPNKGSSLAELSAALKKQYNRLRGQRDELAAVDKKLDTSSTSSESRLAAQVKRTGSFGEARTEPLPSFQRRPREEGADRPANKDRYRDRFDDRRPRDNRDIRRSRSRSPRRERSPDTSRQARREPPRDAHRAPNRNGGDNWRPSKQDSERPSSRGTNDDPRRDHRSDQYSRGSERPPSRQQHNDRRDHRPGHGGDRRDQRGHPARREDRRDDRQENRRPNYGVQRVTDARHGEHRRSTSTSSSGSNRQDNRRRNGVDSYRPSHRA